MSGPVEHEFLTPGRTKVLRNLLVVQLAFGAVLALLGLLFVATGDVEGGVVVVVIGALFGGLGWLALRSVQLGMPHARRIVIADAVVVIILSVLVISILVGLLTVILGVGLLAVTFAPEQEKK